MARPLQKIKNDLIYYAVRLLLALLRRMPEGAARSAGRAFGAFFFRAARGERRKTLGNLKTAFPDRDGASRERLAREVWRELGAKVFETARWLDWPQARIAAQAARGSGWEHLDRALARGRGVLVVSAHLGHWELMAACLAARYPTSAVAQKVYDPRFDRIITDFREGHLGVSMIKRGTALRGILEALKSNRLVIALCDQDSGKDGVFVPFFGKDAWTQSGTARIALKTGAALVPVFAARGADGRYALRVEKEIQIPRGGDAEKDVQEAVRRYTGVIEAAVREYPQQWVWMHDRWRTRPPGETA